MSFEWRRKPRFIMLRRKRRLAPESGKWHAHFKIEKYDGEYAPGDTPVEVVEVDGNALLNAGIQRMLDKFIGAAGQVFDVTHARIGAGNGTTAVTAADTDLSAASGSGNRQFKLVSSISRSGQVITAVATFATGQANFAWEEWGIDAGTADATTVTAPLLNRKVQSMGTKTSAQSWVATATITIV